MHLMMTKFRNLGPFHIPETGKARHFKFVIRIEYADHQHVRDWLPVLRLLCHPRADINAR